MIILHTSIIQTPLFIALLAIVAGVVGYFVKPLIERKKSKHLKIIRVGLSISRRCSPKLNPIGFEPPTISIQLENLSETDIVIKYVSIQTKNQDDIFPVDLINISNDNIIKRYEIKSFTYRSQTDKIIRERSTNEILRHYIKVIETPREFFEALIWYYFKEERNKISWKIIDKKTSELIISINTNIGYYKRKVRKSEIVELKKNLKSEYEKEIRVPNKELRS